MLKCLKLSVAIAFAGTLQVRGTDYKTSDGTCVRDYIDVTDLVDAHVKALEKAQPAKVGIYNVGTGKGRLKTLRIQMQCFDFLSCLTPIVTLLFCR